MRALNLTAGLLALSLLVGCGSSYTYKAYLGEPREALRVAKVEGYQYVRQDIINRYVDGVKFAAIDGIEIDESLNYNSLEVAPGFHDVDVYFYWDMGSQKGLASALVSYATDKESMNRTLRFNARAGMTYSVKAKPYFNGEKEDITNLSYVNFWVEDQNGVEIVSREAGSYQP